MAKINSYLKRLSMEDEGSANVEVNDEVKEILDETGVELPERVDEVPAEDVAEAEAQTEEGKEEVEEVKDVIEEADDVVEETNEEQASVEEFMSVLRHGLKNRQYSAQFAALAQSKLDALSRKLGRSDSHISLEDYQNGSLEDYYSASLESFASFMQKLSEIKDSVLKVIPSITRKGKFVTSFTKRIEGSAAKVQDLLNKVEALDEDEFTVKLPSYLVTSNSDELGTFMAKDLKLLTSAVTAGLPENIPFIEECIAVVEEVISNPNQDSVNAFNKAKKSLKGVMAKYPKQAFEVGNLLAGVVLTQQPISCPTLDAADLPVFAENGGIPGIEKADKLDGEKDVTFSKAKVMELLNTGMAYTMVSNKVTSESGEEILAKVEELSKRNSNNANANSKLRKDGDLVLELANEPVVAMLDAVNCLISRHVQLYIGLNDHCLNVVEATATLAARIVNR